MKRLIIAVLGLLVCDGVARADSYPDRPIKLIQPFAAGGGADLVARAVTDRMAGSMGQPIVSEYRIGNGGILAAAAVAKAPADGYTILHTTNGQAIAPSVQKSLPYDTLRDFVPITEVVKTPLVLLTGPKTGFKTVADFVAAVKGAPGKMTYGSTGVGNPLHLTMEMLKSLAGLDISMAAYRGEAEIEKDLIANEIQAAILPVGISKGFVRSGQLIALAVTSEERAFSLPDVPTLKELGYTNAIAEGWQGWFAPRGTSMEIVTKIHDEAAKALTNPALRKTLVEELDYVIVGSSPAEFRRYFESEISKYAEIVRVAKVPVQQ